MQDLKKKTWLKMEEIFLDWKNWRYKIIQLKIQETFWLEKQNKAKRYFNNNGAQLYLIQKPLYYTLKPLNGTETI